MELFPSHLAIEICMVTEVAFPSGSFGLPRKFYVIVAYWF